MHRALIGQGQQRLVAVGLDVDAQALRRKVLNGEADGSRGCVHAVEHDLGRPLAARCGLGQRDIGAGIALRRLVKGKAESFDTRGPRHDHRALAVLDRLAFVVADQGHDVDGFAGAIDAAVGVHVAIDALAVGPAVGDAAFVVLSSADAVLRQVHRRTLDVHGRVIVVRPVGHDHLGLQGVGAFQQRAGKGHAAVDTGMAFGQGIAIGGDQVDLDAGHRLCRLQ